MCLDESVTLGLSLRNANFYQVIYHIAGLPAIQWLRTSIWSGRIAFSKYCAKS